MTSTGSPYKPLEDGEVLHTDIDIAHLRANSLAEIDLGNQTALFSLCSIVCLILLLLPIYIGGGSGGSRVAECEHAIVIDTDMGLDDLMALGLVLASPAGRCVRAVTVTQGIADVAEGTLNLRRLVGCLDVASRPIVAVGRFDNSSAYTHLMPEKWRNISDALDGVALCDPVPLSALPAANLLALAAAESPGLHVLALGPLTNLWAAAEMSQGAFFNNVGRLVLMGGALFMPGNVPGGKAEWNLFGDTQAAHEVLSGPTCPSPPSPLSSRCALAHRTVMVGLAPTEAVPLSALFDATVGLEPATPAARFILQAIQCATAHSYQFLYDPVAAAVLLNRAGADTITVGLCVSLEDGSTAVCCDPVYGTPDSTDAPFPPCMPCESMPAPACMPRVVRSIDTDEYISTVTRLISTV